MPAGEHLKRLREKTNVSVAKAAEYVGVDAERWRKWEQRNVDPKDSADTEKILNYFEVKSLEDLSTLEIFQFRPKSVVKESLNNSDLLQQFLLNTNHLISGQNKLIEAHKDLTHSNKVLADTQQQLVSRVAPNSNESLDIYSGDEVSALLQKLGQKLSGQKVDSPGKFVAYAMKLLSEIRFPDEKDSVPLDQTSTLEGNQG